jgi:hypothetical protein
MIRLLKPSNLPLISFIYVDYSIDIELALQLGCPTRLGPPVIRFEYMTSICGDQVSAVESPLVYAAIACDYQMQDVVHKIITMTNLFNTGGAMRKLQPLEFQNMVMTVSYNLLSIDSINGSCLTNPFSKGLHRGLLAFVATFLAHVGQQQRPHYEVLRRQFQEIFENQNFFDSISPETYTWLLFAAGMSILDTEKHAAWFKSRLSGVLSKLGIMVWQSAYQVLRKYPWVTAIHDELAIHIWRRCFGHVGDDA